MKKYIIVFTCTVLLSPAATLALPPPHPGPGPAFLADWLQLNDEQKKRVTEIFDQERIEHETLRRETLRRLNQVLTDEQAERFEKVRRQRPERHCADAETRGSRYSYRRGADLGSRAPY